MPAHMKRPTPSRLLTPGATANPNPILNPSPNPNPAPYLPRTEPERFNHAAGAADAFDGVEFAHLQNLPAPRRWARGEWESYTAEVW